ncbi:class 1 fructose-1,6-bisphosphatase [Salinarchaeum chitinilyticum]
MTGSNSAETIDRIVDAVLGAAPELRRLQAEHRGATIDRSNPTGDDVIAADDAADELLVDRLTEIDGVGAVASEERSGVVDAGEGLSVAMDPLDGSSNLDANAPTGTIVGVANASLPAAGREFAAAILICYGPVTTAYVAIEGEGVTEYEIPAATADALDPGAVPEPRVSNATVEIPAAPTIYGVGGGDDDWPEVVASLVSSLREDLKLRYSGALVADVAQVLTNGGVFAYPQLLSRPDGKLRYQFEVAPVALLIEEAGGASTDGTGPLRDRPAEGLHDRSPIYVGNRSVIERVESTFADAE